MVLPLWIIVLLGCVRKIETQSGQGPKLVMSKQKAVKECSNRGKTLMNYKDVTANSRSLKYLSQLEDGASAWIDGYAEYSPFVAWVGCFSSTIDWLNVPLVRLEGNSVLSCLKRCKDKDDQTKYIGVKQTSCYCIRNYNRMTELWSTIVNKQLCNMSCEYNAVDSCGGHSHISVYILSLSIRWAPSEPSEKPCVYIKKSQTSYNAYTASCHTIEALALNGYFCAYNFKLDVNQTSCSAKYENKRYCVMKEAVSRQGAYEGCTRRNGILADLAHAQRILQYVVDNNEKYWIGVYRTFGLYDIRTNETICIAAIKANNLLYLEPDDCSRQKHYLCKEKTNLYSSPIASTISNPTKSATAANATTRKADSETPIAYIVPSMLIVIVLVAIIIFVICWRYKNRRNQHTLDACYKTDNFINEQAVSSVSSDPGQNGESKCLIAKYKPDKPVRQTLKRRTQGAEYENFTLKPEETESQETKKKKGKEKQKQVDDYDKINFKQRNNVKKEADEEVNVYNHVVDTDNDYYDTMKSTKSAHSLGTCKVDYTYSHMKDGVVIGGYCDLATPDEKQCKGAEMRVNSSENMNVAEKDNTLDTNKQPRFVIVAGDSFEGVPNGDKINEMTHSEPVTYTEIAEVGVRREMEYSGITKGTDQDLDDKLSFESVEDECGFRLPEKHSDITVRHVQCIDMDHLKDNEEIILGEVDNAEQKPQLNYVDLGINDTVEAEQA